MLGTSSKSRQKSTSTAFSHQSGVPMAHLGISSVSGSVAGPQFPLRRRSGSPSENGFHLPRAELSDTQRNNDNASDRGGGSTVVTVHDALSLGYT
ncbi:hypothetical protein NHX12_019682 [Muraenolepis orangiensis]|uniref:Uncharacterized protein n=1 Tax=Muraenolepis orangiensis TaxID=630683 RepID=A0A9Q0EVV6_9TELE|nr:hypothetical protein NHX12_019682 [Muraenolepis orangiensis]